MIKWKNFYCGNKLILTHSDGRIVQLLVDKKYVPLLKKHHWFWNKYNGRGYAGTKFKRKTLLLHRFIIKDIPHGFIVDHVNRNSRDNRRCNLRICTHAENMRNHVISRRNTSGITGVRWVKRCRKWDAYWVEEGKLRRQLFYKKLDAVNCRALKARQHYGRFLPA